MQRTTRTQICRTARIAALGMAAAGALVITGCAGFSGTSTAPVTAHGAAMRGSVFGGQQPVAGATIQLYAANLTGYGAGSYALLNTAVTTDVGGSFSITNDYTCPSAGTPVYITATGGSAGSSGTYTGIALMAALGACGNLTPGTFININELTTVAGAYALAPFMSSPVQMSTSATNTAGLSNAFATVNKLVNIATGAMPGGTLPAGATEPVAELNTLANILAACVNSTSGSTCTTLFNNAAPAGGAAPAETLTAILDIARNPGHNVTALYNLSGPTAPFQPTLSTPPTDFTVSLKYAPPGAFSAPSAAAVAGNGDLWVTNFGSNTITVLNATTALPAVYSTGALSGPSGIAFDQGGNAWVPSRTGSTLSVFTSAGVGTPVSVAGLSAPSSIAVDGQNILWITNQGSNSVTSVPISGVTPGAPSSYTAGGLNAPVAVAINPR